VFDVPQLASASHSDSWFDRLGGVAINLIIQWIRINFGFSEAGGKTHEPNDTSCELLSEIPTPPTSKGTYPSFEIVEDLSLQELLVYARDEDSLAPVTSTDVVVEGFNRAAEEVADNPNSLSARALKEALTAAEERNAATIAEYDGALATMPSPPFERESPVELRGDPSQIKPAKMYAMDLTATDLAFFTGNTETKVQIVIALAE